MRLGPQQWRRRRSADIALRVKMSKISSTRVPLLSTARLCSPPSESERELDDLIENTPADGLVGGIASVNGDQFEGHDAQCVVMSYDYSVLAGTQGHQNHRKKDRLFELAEELRLPVVFYTEGGGGRPGDTDTGGVTGLDCYAFLWWGQLSGTVPMVV